MLVAARWLGQFVIVALFSQTTAFVPSAALLLQHPSAPRAAALGRQGASGARMAASSSPLATFGDTITTMLVSSPLYPTMVAKARETMKKTGTDAGIEWDAEVARLQEIGGWEEALAEVTGAAGWTPEALPEYYRQAFHAYAEGNLCWPAALEQIVASKAVGVRNFPALGAAGEAHMRGLYEDALPRMGAYVEPGGRLLDFACGTGTSARRLAARFPQAAEVVGYDLSPHFVAVGRRLQGTGLLPADEEAACARTKLEWGDVTATPEPSESTSLVRRAPAALARGARLAPAPPRRVCRPGLPAG